MSWKHAAIACLALLAVAAGPPGKDRLPADEDPDGRSAWSRFVDGAKDVIHDPLGTSHRRDETKKLPEKTKSKPAQPLEKTKAARAGSPSAKTSKAGPSPKPTQKGVVRDPPQTASKAPQKSWLKRPDAVQRTAAVMPKPSTPAPEGTRTANKTKAPRRPSPPRDQRPRTVSEYMVQERP